jgi:hypothetical protein
MCNVFMLPNVNGQHRSAGAAFESAQQPFSARRYLFRS